MERIYESLADRALKVLISSKKNRVIIAVAGVPGSGKTTLAHHVAQIINNRPSGKDSSPSPSPGIAQVVGMDGYHLTRIQLDGMSNPKEAHERRGAPFTFDAEGVVNLVRKLHQSTLPDRDLSAQVIKAPSFDHRIKDPIPDNIIIPSDAKIILLEGLYILLKDEPWAQIAPLVDDKWFINVDPSIARRRVAIRHVEAGITPNIEKGFERADGNDATNGRYISTQSVSADLLIDSIEEGDTFSTTLTEMNPVHLAIGVEADP